MNIKRQNSYFYCCIIIYQMKNRLLQNNFKTLLSTIRVRQNDFIYQLQQCKKRSFTTMPATRLLKQKLESDRFEQFVERSGKSKGFEVNKFWQKLQALYAMSMERIELLGLSTPTMVQYYEEIDRMLKVMKMDLHCFEDVGRVEYVVSKKLYYALLGKYREDLKIINEKDLNEEKAKMTTKLISFKSPEKKNKQNEIARKISSAKSANSKDNLHLKGLENYFDLKKFSKKIRSKAQSLEFAFQQIQARNANIYKTITQSRNPEKGTSQYYFNANSNHVNDFQNDSDSSSSISELKSPNFKPEFGKSIKSIKYRIVLHNNQRRRPNEIRRN